MSDVKTAKVGVGRGIISPVKMAQLWGYPVIRDTEVIHDDLQATAFAFEYDGVRSLLVNLTIIFLMNDEFEILRDLISRETGVPYENIIIDCTHTHSSPATDSDIKDNEYIQTVLRPGAVKAAKEALANMQEALMGVATVESHVGLNRREVTLKGTIGLGQNPWGTFDPTMTVISFVTLDKKPIANLVHYGTHCTAAGNNYEVTRDWSSVMIDRMEAQTGAMTAFINGPIGDTGPRLADGSTAATLELAMELGGAAALDAMTAYKTIKDYRPIDMKVTMQEVKLPYKPQMSYEDAVAEYATHTEEEKNDYYGRCYHLRKVMAEYEAGHPVETELTINETIISVGPIAFVPFPFEMFTEMTLRLRKFSPYQHTLSLSIGNGYYSYLPSQDQICRGGYEVAMFRDFNPYQLEDKTDTNLVIQLVDILKEMAE